MRILTFTALGAASVALAANTSSKPPNVLFFFTDDQDLLLGSMDYVDAITERVQKHGSSISDRMLERFVRALN